MRPTTPNASGVCLSSVLTIIVVVLVGFPGTAGAVDLTHPTTTDAAAATGGGPTNLTPQHATDVEPCDDRITSMAEPMATSQMDEREHVEVAAVVTEEELAATRVTEAFTIADLIATDPGAADGPTSAVAASGGITSVAEMLVGSQMDERGHAEVVAVVTEEELAANK